MGHGFQIVIDGADPHNLARFWAVAMDLEAKDHSDLIRGLLDQRYADESATIKLNGRLAWKDAATCASADGATRRVFQVVPEAREPKATKNRLHLDVHVGEARRGELIEQLETLGARRLWEGQQGPWTWVTMADPEDNEFCVA